MPYGGDFRRVSGEARGAQCLPVAMNDHTDHDRDEDDVDEHPRFRHHGILQSFHNRNSGRVRAAARF